jgi:branched-chain amino acid transport system ATP-binding protein
VFDNLTVAENLEACVARGAPGFEARRMAQAVYEYFPPLARLRAREAGLLSGGERQMLAIGSALMCAPELLLVDELSLGLAPIVVEELMARLKTIRTALGMTLVLVEQNAQVALDAADYAYVIENGRIVLDGTPDKLGAHQDIREFYLGRRSGGRHNYRDVKQYRRSRRWYG